MNAPSKPISENRRQRFFREEGRRAASPLRFLILLAVSAVILGAGYHGLARRVPLQRSFIDNWFGIFQDSFYFQLIPLLAAFPFSDSFVVDRKQGFLYQLLTRAPYGVYLRAKTLVNALAGGTAAALPLLFLYPLTSFLTKAPQEDFHGLCRIASESDIHPFISEIYDSMPYRHQNWLRKFCSIQGIKKR